MIEFKELVPIPEFSSSLEPRYFISAPKDWTILISDVQGSTEAIQNNRYRDVNKVGVTIIAALRNALGDEPFPFVFGGDGATVLLSSDMLGKCNPILSELPTWIEKSYQMKLRVGVIPIREVWDDGFQLSLAKYQLLGETCIWFFQGGALGEAEKRIKQNPERYKVKLSSNSDLLINCSGLSCRWKPTPSGHGDVLSVLIESRKQNDREHYQEILLELQKIFNGNIQSVNPTNLKQMRYLGFWKLIRDEFREIKSLFSGKGVSRLIEILYCQLVFRFRFPGVVIDANKYLDELAPLSDYYKFDEMIRLVVDFTPTQTVALKRLLEELFQKGEIFYGLHRSDHSLMTCFVTSVNQSDHLHFIDGGDGGYAMAAKHLKKQKSEIG